MNRFRRAISILGATTAAVLVIAGCASGSTSTTDNTPITLTLATFNKFGYSDATSQAAQDNRFPKRAAGSGLGDVEAVEVDWMPKLKQYSNLFVDLTTA